MRIAACVVVLASLALIGCGAKEEPAQKPAPAVSDEPDFEYQLIPAGKDYPLKKCCVDDVEFSTLGHPPIVFAYKMYEVQVCDKKCMKTFGTDPEGFIKTKINTRAIFDK